jgi:hypothetical protein
MKTLVNFLKYHRGKPTNVRFYNQMRKDYIESKYNIINKVSFINGILNPKYNIKNSEGIIGKLNSADSKKICHKLKTDGSYIFPDLLPLEKVEELKEFASNTPLHYLIPDGKNISYSKESVSYNNSKNKSNRYQILDVTSYKSSSEVLKIVCDPNFLHIANDYLGTKPLLDLIVMWWSNSLKNINADEETKKLLKSSSAQMFHFDMDRLKFLKFFIYLTDVTENTGPHVYVKGTNNSIPKYIKQDGRYTDEFITENDGKNIVEITGKAGSIIAVDTRGLHKGKELEEGERLIFQLEFTNSFFGKPEFPVVPEKFDFKGDKKYLDSYKFFFK